MLDLVVDLMLELVPVLLLSDLCDRDADDLVVIVLLYVLMLVFILLLPMIMEPSFSSESQHLKNPISHLTNLLRNKVRNRLFVMPRIMELHEQLMRYRCPFSISR